MVVTKRRSVRVFLALLVLILAGAFFLAAQPEPQSASPLENLLNGSSTDISGSLSSLNDADLPLALAVAEALKFKALHGDGPLSSGVVEQFNLAVAKRLATSKTVSLTRTEICQNAVPAMGTVVAGVRLTVPAHFVASDSLRITDFSPQGEAGTLLPDCWVSFVTEKKPVQIRMAIDGKPVPASLVNDRLAFYRPPLSADAVLAIGTHTASINLADAANSQASVSWSFTVGVTPISMPEAPSEALMVASFPVPLEKVISNPEAGLSLTLLVRETKDGKRYFEYHLLRAQGSDRASLKTTSLWLLQRVLRKPTRDWWVTIATPKTRYAFPGNPLHFSLDFRFDTEGQTTVDKIVWKYTSNGTEETVETPELTILMGDAPMHVDGTVFFTWVNPEQPDNVIHGEVSAWRLSTPLTVDHSLGMNRSFALVSDDRHVEFPLAGNRRILSTMEIDLPEGSQTSIEDEGILIAEKSHWKAVLSSGPVTLVNPLATQTKVLFKGPGVVEIVQEIELVLDWQGEKHSYTYTPEESCLFGVFPASGSVEYEKFPRGVILGTSRLIRLKSLQVEIDKVKKKIAKPEDLFLDPPWILVRSTLFPESIPLGIAALHPTHFFDQFDTLIMPDEEDGFLTRLTYDDPALETEGNLITRAYLGWDELGRKGQAKKTKTKAVEGLLPLSKAQKIKAYPDPAELLDVEIEPAAPPPIGQNQKVDFTGSIVAKPQMGDGRISAAGGKINLLDGYVSQAVEALEWSATLKEEKPRGKGIDFSFKFEPKEGTGTYEIRAGTAVRFEEEDTKTEAGAIGSSTVNLTVNEGFQIKSPVAGFAYPLNHPVPDWTNIDPLPDSDQNLDLWRKIVWALNKEQWVPPADRPPISFTPDKAGEWALAGEIKENGLRDEVKFQVKPITVRISPPRKVVPLSTKMVPLALGVKLGETEITSWGQEVVWVPGLMKAKVEAVEWKAFSSPTTEEALAVSNPPLKAEATLGKEGPLTVLATVTVRIWSTNPQKPYDETFVIPAARADLWAVAPPFWNPLLSTLPDEQFPKKAISPAGRTFTIKEGSVSFEGKDVSWNPQSGLSSPIEIQPAIPSSEVSPVAADKVRLSWSCPGNEPSDSFTYAPAFEKPVETVVKLQSFLVFDEGTDIEFTEKKFTVDVEDINKLVEYYVNPKFFQMTIGEPKTFDFILKLKDEAPPPPPPVLANTKGPEITLLNGVYKLTLVNVDWQYENANGTSSVETALSYVFIPPVIGVYKINGKAHCQIEETSLPVKKRSLWDWWPFSRSQVVTEKPLIRFLVDGKALGSEIYYFGQFVELSFKAETFSGAPTTVESQKWSVSPAPVVTQIIDPEGSFGYFPEITAVEGVKVEFALYDYAPTQTTKTIELTFVCHGQEFRETALLNYVRPILTHSVFGPNLPKVYVSLIPSQWNIGYEQNEESAVSWKADFDNPTEILFHVNAVQLISIDSSRKSRLNGNEYLQTKPLSQFWLDTKFPYNLQPKVVNPHEQIGFPIFFDTPNLGIEKPHDGPAVISELTASESFLTFIVVRPDPNKFRGMWCPVKCRFWWWGGTAINSGSTWVDLFSPALDTLKFSDIETPISLPNWKRRATFTPGEIQNPNWVGGPK